MVAFSGVAQVNAIILPIASEHANQTAARN
jgi:hypothetical protein